MAAVEVTGPAEENPTSPRPAVPARERRRYVVARLNTVAGTAKLMSGPPVLYRPELVAINNPGAVQG